MSTETAAEADGGRGPATRVLLWARDFAVTVVKLVHADVIKLSHYWVIIAGYAAMVGIAALGAYLIYHAEQAIAIKSGSGYAFAISLVLRCIDFGAPIIYVMICILFSIEVSNSTIKYILTRPVTRMELIISKYITALIMFLLAILIFWVIGLFTGGWFYGLGDLVENEYVIFNAGYMYKEMIIATLYLMIPCAAIAAMALMVSTYSSTMGGAIIIGLIIYVFFQILGLIPNSLGITFAFRGEEVLFPYMTLGFPSQRFVPMYILDDLPTGIEIDTWWKWDIQKMVFISSAYFMIFFIASVIGVKKRDFTL
jgi:ABC-type transport system involved in multi-copper enzyme maturation permease subunit